MLPGEYAGCPSLRQAWQMGMFAVADEEISQEHKI